MAQVRDSPMYSVNLRTDGTWNWKVSLSTKIQSDFFTKFPPDTTPSFLVDLGPGFKSLKPDVNANNPWPWKVISVQDLPNDEDPDTMRALMAEGWAAISYAWGEFLPTQPFKYRPVYDGPREQNGLPSAYVPQGASEKRRKEWNWPMHKSTVPSLSLENFRKVVITIGKRFFWWDLACLPQVDYSQGFWRNMDNKDDKGNPAPMAGPVYLSDELNAIAEKEVTKQKYVYDRAAVGAAWLHQITWDGTAQSPTKALLTQAPALIDLETVKTIVSDTTNPSYSGDSVVNVLSTVLGIKNPKDSAAWLTAIIQFKDSLAKIRMEDAWFRSLWSFQEGKLLKVQAFLDSQGSVLKPPGWTLVKGQTPPYPNIKLQVGNDYKDSSSPDVSDITSIATLLASQVSIAYIGQQNPKLSSKAIPALVDLWTKNTKDMSMVVADIASTGLLYYTEDMPLERIIAARRSRYPSFWYADAFYAVS